MNRNQRTVRHLLAIFYALQSIDPRDGRIDQDRYTETINALGELGEKLAEPLFAEFDERVTIFQSGLDTNRGKGGEQHSSHRSIGGKQ